MSEVVITQADDGKLIHAKPNDLITFRLPETPTTGYRWRIASVDESMLQTVGDEFEPNAGPGVGAGGVRTVRFLVKRSGTTDIQLEHRREWEEERPATQLLRVRVQIS